MGSERKALNRGRVVYWLVAVVLVFLWFAADYVVDRADQACVRCGRIRLAEIRRIGQGIVLSDRELASKATPWSGLHERLAGACAKHEWRSFHGRRDGPSVHANYSGYRPPQLDWDEGDLTFLTGAMRPLLDEIVAAVDRSAPDPAPAAREKLLRIDQMFKSCLGERNPAAWQAAWDKIRPGL